MGSDVRLWPPVVTIPCEVMRANKGEWWRRLGINPENVDYDSDLEIAAITETHAYVSYTSIWKVSAVKVNEFLAQMKKEEEE
jgi:hypothetical protein